MKKISMYIVLALAGWSMTACTESHNDWLGPDVYTQEEAIKIEGFSATPTDVSKNNINLGTLAAEEAVQLFTFQKGTLPEGCRLENIRLEAKPTDKQNAQAHNVAATEDGKVTKEELAKLVYAFYGKKATERTFSASLFANAVKNSEAQLITLCDFTLKITPEKIEDPYYYVYGRATAASSANAYKFVMTPVSDVVMTYTAKYRSSMDMLVWNASYWNTDQPNNDFSKVYCTGSEAKAEEGIVIQGDKSKYFVAPTTGYYTFTIDLENLTFKWTKLEDQDPFQYTNISLIGVDGDWNTDIDMQAVDNGKHNWFLEYEFANETTLKFRANHDWTANWGFGSSDGEWTVNDDEWAKVCTLDAKNIAVPAGKFRIYFCDITGAAHFVPVE